MIGKYKIIALITCRVQERECHEFIHELSDQLNNLGYRLFVYNCFSKLTGKTIDSSSQAMVLDLIDNSFIDAVILHSFLLDSPEACNEIIRRMRDADLPVISLGAAYDGCYNISYNHKAGFAKLVSHMVCDHGYRDIHMIAGVKGDPYSEERIDGFMEVLEQNHIPFDESMISYGDFWSDPAIAAVEKLRKENRLPRAFICANDHMAIAISVHLQSIGIRVPEDIAITGYDCIEMIYSSDPTITSASISSSYISAMICETLKDFFQNGFIEKNVDAIPQPVYNRSCGCPTNIKHNAAAAYNALVNSFYRFQDENVVLYEINGRIRKCATFDEVATVMREDDLMYALTCLIKVECIDTAFDPEDESQIGLNDKFLVLYDSDEIDRRTLKNKKFYPYCISGAEIIPDLDYYLSQNRCLIFTLLHYLNVPIGYTCFHFSSYIPGDFYKIPQTVNVLNSALGGLLNLRHKHYLLDKVDELSKTDVLTGLYNRRGFNIEYDRLLCVLEDRELAVIMADLDGLKQINDNFGHDEGDFAIRSVAQALKKVCPEASVCTRFGGDEMMAVFPCSGAEKDIHDLFNRELEIVNAKAQKPYIVSASMGIYIARSGERLSFEELICCSDKLMYEEKKRKKAAVSRQ